MQSAALARAHAAFVEDLRDLLVGMMRDELIDGGNDLRTGLSQRPRRQGPSELERLRGTTAEAHVNQDLVGSLPRASRPDMRVAGRAPAGQTAGSACGTVRPASRRASRTAPRPAGLFPGLRHTFASRRTTGSGEARPLRCPPSHPHLHTGRLKAISYRR